MHRVPLVGILAFVLFALALIPGAGRKVIHSGPARKATWRYRRWRARRRRRDDEEASHDRQSAPRRRAVHGRRSVGSRRGVRSRLRRTRRRITHPSRTVRHWWYRRVDRRH
jgi:hypothetical protein